METAEWDHFVHSGACEWINFGKRQDLKQPIVVTGSLHFDMRDSISDISWPLLLSGYLRLSEEGRLVRDLGVVETN